MYQGGCRQIFIGFESLSQSSLNLINKGALNKVEEFQSAVEKIHSQKISVFGSFILGADGDKKTIFSETANFINSSNIVHALINILTPLPGTPLHQRLSKEKRIILDSWEKYDGQNVCFAPLNMSPKELQEGRELVIKNIYSYDAIFKRLSNLWEDNILAKGKLTFMDILSRKRIILLIKAIFEKDRSKKEFMLKSIYNIKCPAISPVLMGISFHEYYFKK
jgi:radical SAM superfamily enzyme YgiQ (UPF0313 family)